MHGLIIRTYHPCHSFCSIVECRLGVLAHLFFCGWGHEKNMVLEPKSAKTPNVHFTQHYHPQETTINDSSVICSSIACVVRRCLLSQAIVEHVTVLIIGGGNREKKIGGPSQEKKNNGNSWGKIA